MIPNLTIAKARRENIIERSDTKIRKHLVAMVAVLVDKHN